MFFAGSNYSQQDTLLEKYRKKATSPVNDSEKVKGLFMLTWMLIDHGELIEAAKWADKSLELAQKINYKKGLAWSYHNLAILNQERGDYPVALKNAIEALKVREALKSKRGIADTYLLIANIYSLEKDYEQGLKYFDSALNMFELLGDKNGVALCYSNLGIVYRMQNKPEMALQMQHKALRIREELHDEAGISKINSAIANIYMATGRFKESLAKHKEVLKFAEKIQDKEYIAICNGNVGAAYLELKDAQNAIRHLKIAIHKAKEIGVKAPLVNDYEGLAKADSMLGNYKDALEHYKLYVLYRDSLVNEENTKKMVAAQMQYDFDKKIVTEKAKQEKRDALSAEQLKQQTAQRNYFIAGFVLVLLLAVFILRSFLLKRKANLLLEQKNELIEKQKAIVEMKQSEILDSIRYAKRIQSTLVTSEYYINKELKRLNSKKH